MYVAIDVFKNKIIAASISNEEIEEIVLDYGVEMENDVVVFHSEETYVFFPNDEAVEGILESWKPFYIYSHHLKKGFRIVDVTM